VTGRTTPELPRGAGTAIIAGGGAWLPRRQRSGGPRGDEALILTDPCRALVARTADEIPALLDDVGAEQARGRYVVGYVAYEAGAAFGLTVKSPDSLPLAWMAAYPAESVRRLSGGDWGDLLDAVDGSKVARAVLESETRLSVSHEHYIDAITHIKGLIAAGDTYQVNYTVRARFDLDMDPLDYFLALVVRQPVPYAAYLDIGEAQILSLSPELFLRRQGRWVESRPMKGTRPRGDNLEEDAALAYELISSEKDRAENLMIVDMVRNDLGRVSRAGSVRVPALFAVEPYRTVWQMTSAVVGKVRRDARLREIMAATFPGASITGAPKHHTMEIIDRLETEPRGVYTGTVGLFLPDGGFTCNLAIRTLIHERGSFRLGVGSGIVWDSDPEDEYQETLIKASFALPPPGSCWESMPAAERIRAAGIGLFETILLEAGRSGHEVERQAVLSRYRQLSRHLDRMAASAAQLGFSFDRAAAESDLTELARFTDESVVVRLGLSLDGELRPTARPVPERAQAPIALMVSPFRTDPGDPLLVHKTTARYLYDQERQRALASGCHEALFLNRIGHVTEGAITNVFARFGHSWATPPVEDGLLPGIWRADFFREKGARERSLTLDDLLLADEIVMGNSVRGGFGADSVVVSVGPKRPPAVL
jgi:para-aminobenzoate synthetase / 4-amino-4-deoxychorismate lyase